MRAPREPLPDNLGTVQSDRRVWRTLQHAYTARPSLRRRPMLPLRLLLLLAPCWRYLGRQLVATAAVQPPPGGESAAPPAGWSYAAGHCLGPPGGASLHCDCSSPPVQLSFGNCAPASCYTEALAACKANPKCKSFATTTAMGGAYETYSLNNCGYLVLASLSLPPSVRPFL